MYLICDKRFEKLIQGEESEEMLPWSFYCSKEMSHWGIIAVKGCRRTPLGRWPHWSFHETFPILKQESSQNVPDTILFFFSLNIMQSSNHSAAWTKLRYDITFIIGFLETKFLTTVKLFSFIDSFGKVRKMSKVKEENLPTPRSGPGRISHLSRISLTKTTKNQWTLVET